MRKVLTLGLVICLLQACNNDRPGETGVVNDGMEPVDKNGAFPDTGNFNPRPSTDSAIGDDRADTQQRDSIPGQKQQQ